MLRPGTIKVYSGRREAHGCVVEVSEKLDHHSFLVAVYPLKPRNDLVNHSPNGFEWGYAGSGPAQLSFALLLDYLGDKRLEKAQKLYQRFKFAVITRLEPTWTLTGDEIEQILADLEKAEIP